MITEFRFRQKIQKGIRHLAAGVIRHPYRVTFNVAHESIEIIARIGDADYANRGSLPGLARVNFRHRDIEVIAQAVFHAAHHLPLVLQGVRAFDANLQHEIRDHMSLGCKTSRIPGPLERGFSSGTMNLLPPVSRLRIYASLLTAGLRARLTQISPLRG